MEHSARRPAGKRTLLAGEASLSTMAAPSGPLIATLGTSGLGAGVDELAGARGGESGPEPLRAPGGTYAPVLRTTAPYLNRP